ncbi:MAG: 1-(5-phosphoribosyl)-5-[(5-phosphoribosylamino)methylideneamino]imidazole-4-carboxamide isomerase [Coriobacteriales bacterium]|jgi:phosphoribosylformimino-5-aminoimidazole carboxamide ribotide isomerase|nr:1-(5-phosphoribosyl)-5-[(5-phosphoribosylamino)methylideneamino]imidazole-4-carboxamide isomerase [Coriobacteriales bacterium]
MYILPAIDLLDGTAVRLAKGDYNAVTVYNKDPVAQALKFAQAGAQWIHVVDLNGARTGIPAHSDVIKNIIHETGLKIEVGGGIRTLQAIDSLASAGVSRVVIGTKLAQDSDFAREAVANFGELICAGVDARDGEVAIQGWNEGTGVLAIMLISELAELGIRHLVYTDIARDGMQTGIDTEMYLKVSKAAGFAVIASGGVASLEDLQSLARLGDDTIEGVICGRAIYENAFTVEQALAAVAQISAANNAAKNNDANAATQAKGVVAVAEVLETL